MDDGSFPRGGHQTSKDSNKDAKEERELFKTDEGPKVKTAKKKLPTKLAEKKAKLKKEKSQDQFSHVDTSIGILTVKGLSSGMVVVGVVKEIGEYHLVVSLPNGLRGHVSMTSVCHPYTALLQQMTTGETVENVEDVGELQDLFRVGQPVRCKVLEVSSGGKKGHYKIQLTTDPRAVNAGLVPTNLKNNMVLSACVASCEDHGYVLDIGVKGVSAFLKNKQADKYIADWRDGENLVIGTYLNVVVNAGATLERHLGEGRAINVDVDPSVVSRAVVAPGMGITMHSLVPGMCFNANVTKVDTDGLRVKALSYRGYIHRSHLQKDTAEYKAGEQHMAVVLYVQPVSKLLVLSVLPHLVMPHLCPRNMFASLHAGNILEKVKVMSADKSRGVYVKITDDITGMAYLKDLSDSVKVDVDKEFPIGSTHRCRIVDFDYADRLVVVSFKPSVLEKQFLQLSDIKPGMIVEGNVKSIEKKGVVVKVTKNIDGFIHNIHLADVPLSKQAEKVFHIGQKIICRAVIVKPEKRRLLLTHKRSLVHTSLPVLTEYQQARPGTQVEGTITEVVSAGLLVAFYNNVRGIIPKRELGDQEYLEQTFQTGQLIKCYVINCSSQKKRLTLSVSKSSKTARTSEAMEVELPNNLAVGKPTDCTVKTVQKQGLDVKLPGCKLKGYLPKVHLSDLPALSDLMAQHLQPSDVLSDVVVLGARDRGTNVLLSNKHTVKTAGAEVARPHEELTPEMIVPGCVKRVLQQGLIVDLYNGNEGFCPLRYVSDRGINQPSKLFSEGQSVLAKVMPPSARHKQSERKQVDVSVRLSDVASQYEESGHDLMHDYVNFYTALRHIRAQQEKDSELYDAAVGDVLKVTVKEVSDSSSGLKCQLKDGSNVVVSKDHMAGVSAKVGEKLDAVLLFHDFSNNRLQVSVKKSLLADVKQLVDTKFTQVSEGQTYDSEVVLVKEAFVLVALKSTAKGRLAYVPTRTHLNDVFGPRQFIVGQSNKVIIDEAENGLVYAHLAKDDKKKNKKKTAENSTEQQQQERKKDSAFEVGSVHQAKVKCVKGQYLLVDVRGRKGRVHMSEMTDEIPREGFLVFKQYIRDIKTLTVKVIGTEKLPSAAGAISKDMTEILQCSARPSVVSHKDSPAAPELKKGAACNVFITEVHNDRLVVHVSLDVTGIIYLHDAADSLKTLKNFRCYFKVGQGYSATVIGRDLNSGQRMFSILESEPLAPDAYLMCRVSEVHPDCLRLNLPGGLVGRAALTDLSDTFHDDPTSKFSVGQYVEGCVLTAEEGRAEANVSLRKSRLGYKDATVKDKEMSSLDDLKKGDVMRGYITDIKDSRLIVELSRTVSGHVLFFHTSLANTKTQADNNLYVGQLVTAYVFAIKSGKVQLSLLQKHTNMQERLLPKPIREEVPVRTNKRKSIEEEEEEDVDSPPKKRKNVSGSPAMKSKKRKASEEEEEEEGESLTNKRRHLGEDTDSGVEVREEDMEQSGDSDEEEKEKVEGSSDHLNLGSAASFSWDNALTLPTDSQTNAAEDSDEDEEEEEEQDKVKAGSKKTRAERLADRAEEEKKLFAMEKAQLEGTGLGPETADQFDRLVLQSPNSSLVWIRFMAFHLETAEIEKARAVAERALKTIAFREEEEKLNVWVAYMNFENIYGTPESLKSVFDRALSQNEQSKVYKALVKIYIEAKKTEEADRLYGIMMKKFGAHDLDLWVSYAVFFYKESKFEQGRKLLPRAVEKLANKKHSVELTSRIAQLEFKFGHAEQGKTHFENLISSYPKRTDIWSVYIDMLTKAGDLDTARGVFERAINLKVSLAKIKTFFDKFLKFEEKYGTPSTVAGVKKKILEFVKSQ